MLSCEAESPAKEPLEPSWQMLSGGFHTRISKAFISSGNMCTAHVRAALMGNTGTEIL